MFELARNQYGKARVRVMRVDRNRTPHRVDEWTVEVALTGDFLACFRDGDNSAVLPTDTMKNTVYSLARRSQAETMEDFAGELAGHFLRTQPQIESATILMRASAWHPLVTASGQHPSAFAQAGPAADTCEVMAARGEPMRFTAGLQDVVILKTDRSAFSGFLRDPLTTLKETEDRLLGTSLSAQWLYAPAVPQRGFAAAREAVRDALLSCFATHTSRSVQQTLYAMAEAALQAEPAAAEISLSMPNRHCNLVDLAPFGQTNPNHIFVPTDEPHGAIEATVRRKVSQ